MNRFLSSLLPSLAAGLIACGGDDFDGAQQTSNNAGVAGQSGQGGAGQAGQGGTPASGAGGSALAGAGGTPSAGEGGSAGAGQAGTGQSGAGQGGAGSGQAGMAGAGQAGTGGAGGNPAGKPCKVGEFACDGNSLFACKNTTLTFVPFNTCGDSEFCDAQTGSCKACKPLSVLGCETEKSLSLCREDGTPKKEQACPKETPFCVDKGECVECVQDSDCKLQDTDENECYQPACTAGVCLKNPSPSGTKTAKQPSGECTQRVCDGAGSAKLTYAEPGTACSAGVCFGEGSCGECLPGATRCTGSTTFQLCNQEGKWSESLDCKSKPACSSDACQGVEQVAVGGDFACALLSDGSVRCWGSIGASPVSEWASSFKNIKKIMARSALFCALDADGKVSCMGNNFYGHFGNGTKSGSLSDVHAPAPAAIGVAFRDIAMGETHGCGIDLAGENIYCWGNNQVQQTGLEKSILEAVVPTKIPALSPAKSDDTIATGSYHSCLLREKKLFCWGDNSRGQVGNKEISESAPVTEVPLPGDITTIYSGIYSQIALISKPSAEEWFWGENLFEPNIQPSATPTAPSSLPNGPFLGMSLGYYAFSWISTAGTLYVKGSNIYGQLGNGNVSSPGSPEFATTTHSEASWGGVSVGISAICAWVQGGEAWCWGDNKKNHTGTKLPDTYVTTPTRVQW